MMRKTRFIRAARHVNLSATASCHPAIAATTESKPVSFFGFVSVLIIGAISGWLAGRLVTGYGFGVIGNIVVGVVGALIAQYLFPRIGLGFGGGAFSDIIRSTVGAVVLLVLIRVIKRG
jgi:uncharacterized membrane protein YeaQ/YmgE (transglycosylase-associated protein family)